MEKNMLPTIESLDQLQELEASGKLEGFFKVPDHVYFKSDRLSQSILSRVVSETPRHAKFYYQHGTEKTDAMDFGTMVHKLILEPSDFKNTYAVMEKVDGRTKEGKAYKKQFDLDNADKLIITKDDYDKAKYMMDGFIANDSCVDAIASCEFETAMFWVDPKTKIPLKAKVDCLDLENHKIIDVKTTLRASDSNIMHSVRKFRYDFQQYFYCMGYQNLTGHFPDFSFIFIDKCNPSTSRKVYIDGNTIMARALVDVQESMRIWQDCTKKGYWPSYGDTLTLTEGDLHG